jgi:hypothetical protein
VRAPHNSGMAHVLGSWLATAYVALFPAAMAYMALMTTNPNIPASRGGSGPG